MLTEDEVLRNIGRNIRKYRELRGLTREKLAEIAEIDVGYLGQCERGETQLGIAKTVRIIKFFEVSPQEIIVLPNSRQKDKQSEYLIQITDVLAECTDNQLALILNMLQVMIPFIKE